jgi:hypothetical protein
MSGLSRYAANALFDRTLNPSTRERPVYLGLHRSAPNDATYGSEATFTSYVRMPANNLYAIEEVGADGEVMLVVKNGSDIQFPGSGGPAQPISHWAFWDSEAVGQGNILYSGSLQVPRTVDADSILVVWANELTLTFI